MQFTRNFNETAGYPAYTTRLKAIVFLHTPTKPTTMKVLLPLLLTALLISCGQPSDHVLSEAQKKKIQEEIRPVIAQVFEAAANVDTAKLYGVFSFGDDFTYVEITGKFYDQVAYKQMAGQFWGQLTNEKFAKGQEKLTYVSATSVLWSYSGAVTITFKRGQQATYDPFGMSMLLKKTDGQWKVVFVQESTQEPAPADSTKH
jgi:ketosteroid isomerase-like protein